MKAFLCKECRFNKNGWCYKYECNGNKRTKVCDKYKNDKSEVISPRNMSLKEFVNTFVCRNTLVRLWKPAKGGYDMIRNGDNVVCMEWELIKGEVWQSKYNDYEVIGVKDIAVDDFYREAVNIVIDDRK